MNQIQKLLDGRTRQYKRSTEAIFKEIDNVHQATLRMIDTIGENLTSKFSWDDIVLLQEDVILLVGKITYQPGDVIVSENGIPHQVTEDHKGKLEHMINVSLPVSMAATGTADEIYTYFDAHHNHVSEINNTVDVEDETYENVAELESALTKLETGFVIDDLSEDQKKNFIPSGSTKGVKH